MQRRAYYMMIPEDGTELTPRCEHAATVCTGIRLLLPSGPDITVRCTIMRHCPKRLCIVQTRTARMTLEGDRPCAILNGVSPPMKGPWAPVPGAAAVTVASYGACSVCLSGCQWQCHSGAAQRGNKAPSTLASCTAVRSGIRLFTVWV